MVEVPAALSGSSFFRGLSATAIAAILAKGRPLRFAPGAIVFHQDGDARFFYVLASGQLRVNRTTAEGRQVVVRFVAPGDAFGIAVAMGRKTFPATATAILQSDALAWPSALWQELVALHPVLAKNALGIVGGRLDAAHQRIVEISTEEVERRVAHALLHLADQSAAQLGGEADIAFPISRQDVAELSATTLYSVSRLISAWADKGLVEGGRQKIRITDRQRLRAIADGLQR